MPSRCFTSAPFFSLFPLPRLYAPTFARAISFPSSPFSPFCCLAQFIGTPLSRSPVSGPLSGPPQLPLLLFPTWLCTSLFGSFFCVFWPALAYFLCARPDNTLCLSFLFCSFRYSGLQTDGPSAWLLLPRFPTTPSRRQSCLFRLGPTPWPLLVRPLFFIRTSYPTTRSPPRLASAPTVPTARPSRFPLACKSRVPLQPTISLLVSSRAPRFSWPAGFVSPSAPPPPPFVGVFFVLFLVFAACPPIHAALTPYVTSLWSSCSLARPRFFRPPYWFPHVFPFASFFLPYRSAPPPSLCASSGYAVYLPSAPPHFSPRQSWLFFLLGRPLLPRPAPLRPLQC